MAKWLSQILILEMLCCFRTHCLKLVKCISMSFLHGDLPSIFPLAIFIYSNSAGRASLMLRLELLSTTASSSLYLGTTTSGATGNCCLSTKILISCTLFGSHSRDLGGETNGVQCYLFLTAPVLSTWSVTWHLLSRRTELLLLVLAFLHMASQLCLSRFRSILWNK